jgi:hypothetical protein
VTPSPTTSTAIVRCAHRDTHAVGSYRCDTCGHTDVDTADRAGDRVNAMAASPSAPDTYVRHVEEKIATAVAEAPPLPDDLAARLTELIRTALAPERGRAA